MIFFLRFHEERVENTPYQASPVHHTVHDGLLLGAGPPQIDPGGLNALMSHKVRQQGQVIEPFQKAFGKPVAEGMGIGHRRIDAVPEGHDLQLSRHTPGGDPASLLV